MNDMLELDELIPSTKSPAKLKRINRPRYVSTADLNQEYLIPEKALGIDSWISLVDFSKYTGKMPPVEFLKSCVTNFFQSYPSAISSPEVNIYSVIKQLKSLGSVQGIFSGYYGENKPSMVCLFLEIDRHQLFAYIDNITYVSPEGYKGYNPDELISGLIPLAQILFLFKNNNTSIYQILNSITKSNLEWIEESYIDMIVATDHGLGLRSITLDPVEDFDLNIHYGESFQSYNDKLLERLDKKDKGIVMFHGPPGTGKTHYIRSLIPRLTKMNKRVIIIPKHVLSNLESPAFNTFMIENFAEERIVFIIEDAESIVAKRESSGGYRSELVSTLLNITDGILNDIFNIQVILTFNTELSSIDDALLRKGRLISKYEFENLDRDTAKKLADKIGVTIVDQRDSYSLADIYALKEREDDDILINQNIKKEKSFVGF